MAWLSADLDDFDQLVVAVPMTNGVNVFNLQGISHTGQPIANASDQLTVNYTKATPSPVGYVVINEIM